jgi:PKD repeat protein
LAGQTVQFTPYSALLPVGSTNILTIDWDFGDLSPIVTTLDTMAVSHKFAKAGTYLIKMTANAPNSAYAGENYAGVYMASVAVCNDGWVTLEAQCKLPGKAYFSDAISSVIDKVQVWIGAASSAIQSVVWRVINALGTIVETVTVTIGTDSLKSFSAIFPTIATGEFTVSAEYKDSNNATIGGSSLILNIVPAAVPTISSVKELFAEGAPTIPQNGSTSSTLPWIIGSLDKALGAGHKVVIYDGSNRLQGAADMTDPKSWSFVPSLALPIGTHSLRAVVVAADGIESEVKSTAWVLTITTPSQPTVSSYPTSCGAPITSIAFTDSFPGTSLDSSKWTTTGAGTAGTIVVTPGKAQFNVAGDNLFAQSVGKPIPATGDFSMYCKGKLYSSSSSHGAICDAHHNDWPAVASLTADTYWAVWARYGQTGDTMVASVGAPGPVLFTDNFPADINSTHEYELCVRGDQVERFKDGVSLGKATLPAGWIRPERLAMGNPGSPGPSWTSLETNAIEVRTLR